MVNFNSLQTQIVIKFLLKKIKNSERRERVNWIWTVPRGVEPFARRQSINFPHFRGLGFCGNGGCHQPPVAEPFQYCCCYSTDWLTADLLNWNVAKTEDLEDDGVVGGHRVKCSSRSHNNSSSTASESDGHGGHSGHGGKSLSKKVIVLHFY